MFPGSIRQLDLPSGRIELVRGYAPDIHTLLGNENIMARITFTATSPAGDILTRTSESKTYSHVVITNDGHEDSWGALSWSSSEALAQKAATTFRNRGQKNVQVIAAEVAAKPARRAAKTQEQVDAEIIADPNNPVVGITNVEVDGTVVATVEKHDLTVEDIKVAATEAIAEAKADAKAAKTKAPTAAEKRAAEKAAKEAEKAAAEAAKTEALRQEVITTMAAELKHSRETREELAAQERRSVVQGRAIGLSWATLGEMAGLSGVGMRNRYIDLATAK
jgi:hypothetical protein